MAKKKKDWGENSKSTEARSRKAAAKAQQREINSRRLEDEYWAAAGEGARSKAQQKRDQAEQRRQEAAKRREETKRLAAEEETSMAASSKKGGTSRVAGPKVTHHELRLQQEAQRKADEQAVKAQKTAVRNTVEPEAYARMVDVENVNRNEDVIEATTVDQALAALDVTEEKEDRHPERRRKAAYLAFEERELDRLQQDKPGLKHSQYKDMIFKQWQKSRENPMNAVGTVTK